MLSKISILEGENKSLHEENLSLRLENLQMKMEKIHNKNNEKIEDVGLGPCNVFDNVFESKHSKESQKMNFGVSQRRRIMFCNNPQSILA